MPLALTKPELEAFLARDFPQVSDDFVLEEVADKVIVRLKVADRHLRPGGTVSGPSMFALADVAVYLAILARIGPVALAVTTSAHIDFMRKPVSGVDLIGEARLLKLGRSLVDRDLVLYEVQIIMEYLDERFPHPPLMPVDPVARASLTYSIPPQRDAAVKSSGS